MSMTFQQFIDYLTTHLWKIGDSLVVNNLPTIIKTADAELNASFKVEDRNTIMEATAVSRRIQMPLDFRSMIALANPRYGGMTYRSQRLFSTDLINNMHGTPNGSYTVSGNSIYLTGSPSVDQPFDLVMIYYRNLPDFAVEDQSWMADKFLNVYLYCVLKHTATFLREDERLAVWTALYQEAFNLAMEENAHEVKFAGTPLKMHMGGVR